MNTEKKVAGYLYWKTVSGIPRCTRIPIDSGTPVGSYSHRFALDENEMGLELDVLAHRYPWTSPNNEQA